MARRIGIGIGIDYALAPLGEPSPDTNVNASTAVLALTSFGATIDLAPVDTNVAANLATLVLTSHSASIAAGGVTIPIFFHHYSQQRNQPVQTLRQSTASQAVLLGPFVDSTDGVTAETGLTIANTDIRLSKNGGNMAAKNSGGGTHDENGWYTITLDATDTNTVGRLQVSCVVAGALPVHMEFQVVEEAVYDQQLASGVDGVITADVVRTDGHKVTVSGVCTTGGGTTTVVATSTDPASTGNDQWIGRDIVFSDDTTTAALQGAVGHITDYVHSTKTFTVVGEVAGVLPGTPTTNDTFVIV